MGELQPAQSAAARELRSYLPTFVRALKTWRLYPANSDMRQQAFDVARRGLAEVLARHGAITLGVRDGAFLFGEEEVYHDDDTRNGPTYFLAGHAIFELTLEDGLDARELQTFMGILCEDPQYRCRAGEDLVTLFWRFHMERIRHRHVDVLRVAVRADSSSQRRSTIVDDEETARLQTELARMIRVLAVDPTTGEDISEIIDRELDSSEAIRIAADGDRRRFESAIRLAESRISRRYLDAIRLDINATRSHDFLAERMADLLIEALASEPNPYAAQQSGALAVFVSLFAGMLRDRHLDTALHLIQRVRGTGAADRTPMELAVSRLILEHISGDSTATTAVQVLDRTESPEERQKLLMLLGALGDDSIPHVLRAIELAEQEGPRRALAALAVEITPHRRSDLYELMRTCRWELAGDLLQAANALGPRERAELIAIGVVHSHPSVRSQANRCLLRFAPGRADDFLARALRDSDVGVRTVAVRCMAMRRNPFGAKHLAALINREDFFDRDPGEVRLVLLAYALAGGAGVLPELEKFLAKTSGLASGHKGGLESVTFAISVIDAPAARDLLTKGAKSLNPFLRGACKNALAQGGKTELMARGIVAATTEAANPVDPWPDINPSRVGMLPTSPAATPSGRLNIPNTGSGRFNIPNTPSGSFPAPFHSKTPPPPTTNSGPVPLPVAPPRTRSSVTGIPIASPAPPRPADDPPPLLPADALQPIEE